MLACSPWIFVEISSVQGRLVELRVELEPELEKLGRVGDGGEGCHGGSAEPGAGPEWMGSVRE